MTDWNFAPIYSSYSAVAVLAMLLIAGLYVLKESQSLTSSQRVLLWSLRLAIGLVVILAMLRPGLTFTQQSAPKGAIAVMIDQSTSMELASGIGSQSRWDVERHVWNRIQASSGRLGKGSEFVLYTYDDQLKKVARANDGSLQLPDVPSGPLTDVGASLAQLFATQIEPPLTGIIWTGDAAQTVTPPTVDPPFIARQLGNQDIPLLLIGIGPKGDTERVIDLALESVPEQFEAFASNQIVVTGTLRAHGALNRDLTVQLGMVRGSETKLLQQTVVRPDQNDQTLPFRLPMTAPDEGAYELVVRVLQLNGEMVAENNEATSYLNVRGGGSRILYLEGEPSREQKAIWESLAASPDFQVDFRLIPQSTRSQWPKVLRDELKPGAFDAIILGDLDSDAIGQDSLRQLVESVKSGTGLITLGGYHAYGPGGYADTPLASILPIKIGTTLRQSFSHTIIPQAHRDGPIKFLPKVDHEILALGESRERSLDNWNTLRPLLGANHWAGVKSNPGVRVLAEDAHQEPEALMVIGEAEKGRILSLAFDSTYQWTSQGKSDLHKRFWRQAVIWALRREPPVDSLRIEMSERRLYRQQTTNFVVHWNHGSTDSTIPSGTRVRLMKDGKDLGPIPTSLRDNVSMAGRIPTPSESGRYELLAESISSDARKLEARLPFVVLQQSIESMQPIPDWQLMSQMARSNASAGGGLFVPEQVDEMIDKLIERRRAATIQIVESYRLGDGTLDSWLTFLLLFGLLSIQWSLRKRWNLA